MSEDNYRFKCSFCHKKHFEVKILFTSKKKDSNSSEIFICDECIKKCHNNIPTENYNNEEIINLLPKDLYKYLSTKIEGQDKAKKKVSLCVYEYLKIFQFNKKTSQKDEQIKSESLLLHGPTGSGKSLIISTICNKLNLPFIIFDSTSLSQTGYVGRDVNDYLEELYIQLIKYNPHIAKQDYIDNFAAVVVFEEIDKLAGDLSNSSGNKDVSGRGVQQGLLRHIEGSDISFKISQDNLGRSINKRCVINTSNILYVGVGAFSGIEKIAQEQPSSNIQKLFSGKNDDNVIKIHQKQHGKELKMQHFIKYGMMEELMGRFCNIVPIIELSTDNLVNILKTHTIKSINQKLKLSNLSIECTDKLYDHVAKLAKSYKTGARSLPGIMNSIINDYIFNLDLTNKQSILIDYKNEEVKITSNNPQTQVIEENKSDQETIQENI